MNKNTSAKDRSLYAKQILIAGLIGTMSTIVFLFISSILIQHAVLTQKRGEVIGSCCLFLGAIISALIITRKAKNKRAINSLLSGAVLIFFLLLNCVLHMNSNMLNMQLLINTGVIVLGSLLGSMMSLKHRRKRR